MTFNELKYIVAVAKHRHFRKASEHCFVSQPTLSIAIKKLEEELGITLFERHKSEIIITPIGKKIVQQAEDILKKISTIKQLALEEQGDQSSELKLGAIYTIAPYLLPKLISQFHQKCPNIPLIIEENFTHVLINKLNQGDLDLVILSLPFKDPNIETQVIYEEPFVAALPKNHKLSAQKHVSLNELQQQTFLLLGSGHCFRDQVLNSFPPLQHYNADNKNIQRTLEGSSLETIRYMVASGAGITILPCSSIQEHANLLDIKTIKPKIPSRQVALAWRKDFPRQQALKLFIEALQSIKIPCTIKSNPS